MAGLRTQDSWWQLFPSEPTVPLKPPRRLGALSQKRLYVKAKWGWAAGRGGAGVWEAESGCLLPRSHPASLPPFSQLGALRGRAGPLALEQGKGGKPRQTARSLTRMGLTTKDRRTDDRRTVTLSSGPHRPQALSAQRKPLSPAQISRRVTSQPGPRRPARCLGLPVRDPSAAGQPEAHRGPGSLLPTGPEGRWEAMVSFLVLAHNEHRKGSTHPQENILTK